MPECVVLKSPGYQGQMRLSFPNLQKTTPRKVESSLAKKRFRPGSRASQRPQTSVGYM